MRESLLKAEAKYLDQDKDSDTDSNSSKDSDSSDEDVYSKKPKPNSSNIRCEENKEVLNQKNYAGRIQSLKHKKNERVYNRNKII